MTKETFELIFSCERASKSFLQLNVATLCVVRYVQADNEKDLCTIYLLFSNYFIIILVNFSRIK